MVVLDRPIVIVPILILTSDDHQKGNITSFFIHVLFASAKRRGAIRAPTVLIGFIGFHSIFTTPVLDQLELYLYDSDDELKHSEKCTGRIL